MARLTVPAIQTILTMLVLAAALILGGNATASAQPGHDLFVQYDENDQTWATDRFEETLREMMNRYPEVGSIWFTADIIGDVNTVAAAGPSNIGEPLIILQEAFAEQPAGLVAAVLADIDAGYHPAGCDPVRVVAIHEFGHVLTEARGNRALQPVIDLVNANGLDGLHAYGRTNVHEAIATAFAAVHCGSQSPLEQQIYNILVTT